MGRFTRHGMDDQPLEGGGRGAGSGGYKSSPRKSRDPDEEALTKIAVGLGTPAAATGVALAVDRLSKNKTPYDDLPKKDSMTPGQKQSMEEAKDEEMRKKMKTAPTTKTEMGKGFDKGGMTASSRTKDKDKNEDENKEFSRGKRALGAAMAVPGAITGATLLGTQPDFPVYDSAKYGAKLMLAKNKREEREAGEELESAVKLRKSQKRQANTGEKTNPMGDTYKKGGMTASSRADGCAVKGKTRGKMIK